MTSNENPTRRRSRIAERVQASMSSPMPPACCDKCGTRIPIGREIERRHPKLGCPLLFCTEKCAQTFFTEKFAR